MADNDKKRAFATRTIHAGQEPDPGTGAIMQPIYATSIGRWKHYREHLAPLMRAMDCTIR